MNAAQPAGPEAVTAERAHPEGNREVLHWLARRAASDEQMRAAAQSRRLLPPEPEDPEPDQPVGLPDELTRQHNELNALTRQLSFLLALWPEPRSGPGAPVTGRRDLVGELVPWLERHAVAEERTVWPLVARLLPGDAAGQRDAGLEIERLAQQLARLDPGGDEFDQVASQLIQQCARHAALMDALLARLRDAGSKDDQREWGDLGRQARQLIRSGTAEPGTAEPGTAEPGTADTGTADTGTAGPRTGGHRGSGGTGDGGRE